MSAQDPPSSDAIASTEEAPWHATLGYTAPFVAFVAMLAIEKAAGVPAVYFYPLRFTVVLSLILIYSRRYLSFRPQYPLASIALGVAVFVIWVAPDVLFGYRHSWMFDNSLLGSAVTSLPVSLKQNVPFMALRAISSAALVPILEELFWRGWLMRWLIAKNFLAVPLGKYVPYSFWMVAILFASEHGPYWEVGLVAGVIYNWWIIRTRNLADCILAHGVTNAVLSAYVLATGQWQYWL
jgi:CAAX prenyl protease-like protein